MDNQVATSVTQIRREINELAVGAANIKRRREGVVELLRLRSQLESSVRDHEEAGLELRPERTRLKTIDDIFTREAKTILRQAKASGGLAAARDKEEPPEDHWWWYLDRQVSEARRKQVIKVGSLTAGAIVVILVGSLLMNRFSGTGVPDKKALGYVSAGEQLVRTGDYTKAIVEYEQAVKADPNLGDGYVALGVLYDLEGRADESREALATARDLIGDEADYLVTLAQAYGAAAASTGEDSPAYMSALTYADQAIALAPNSTQAYLIRAGIYEAAKQRAEAVADLERAGDLAQANGETELQALVKMRLGMLLQQVPDNAFTPPADGS